MEEDFDSFDHRLKMLFIEKIPYSLIGDRVVLSNDQLARVVFINPNHPEAPIVKTEDEYLDLSSQSELSVKKLLRDLEQLEEMMEETEQN
jgi:hypothetical protein